MHVFFYFFFFVSTSNCSSIEKDFTFYETSKKKNKYSIKGFKNKLEKKTGMQFSSSPIFIIVKADSKENSKYIEQFQIFFKLGHEDEGFIINNFITYISNLCFDSPSACYSLYTPLKEDEKVNGYFKTLIVDDKANVLFSGDQVISADKLQEIIKNPQKSNQPYNLIGVDHLIFNGKYIFWYDNKNKLTDKFLSQSRPQGKILVKKKSMVDQYIVDRPIDRDDKPEMTCKINNEKVGYSSNLKLIASSKKLLLHPAGEIIGTKDYIGINCKDAKRFKEKLDEHFKKYPNAQLIFEINYL